MDPSFLIPKIQCQIRNQWSQKPWSTKFRENRWVSKILCPLYWVHHFKFRKSDVKFVINDLENCGVQTYAKIVEFPKFHVHYVGSAILISKIQCQIRKQPPRKLLSTEFCGNCMVFQNYVSDILDIRHFAKGIAIWDRWDKFFLAVQLFRSPLIIVRIKSQYSFGSKKKYEKKNPDFLVLFSKFGAILDFLLDQTQFWSRILEDYQNSKETWVSFENFSFSVMRMRLEHNLKNCSSWSLMG